MLGPNHGAALAAIGIIALATLLSDGRGAFPLFGDTLVSR